LRNNGRKTNQKGSRLQAGKSNIELILNDIRNRSSESNISRELDVNSVGILRKWKRSSVVGNAELRPEEKRESVDVVWQSEVGSIKSKVRVDCVVADDIEGVRGSTNGESSTIIELRHIHEICVSSSVVLLLSRRSPQVRVLGSIDQRLETVFPSVLGNER